MPIVFTKNVCQNAAQEATFGSIACFAVSAIASLRKKAIFALDLAADVSDAAMLSF